MFKRMVITYKVPIRITAIVSFIILIIIPAFAQTVPPSGPNVPADISGPNAPVPPSPEGPNAPATIPPYTGQPVPGEPAPQPAMTPGQPAAAPSPQMPAAAPGTPAEQPMQRLMRMPMPARSAIAGGGSSFFFDDADVFEVIQTVFGEVLRVNYIIDPSVKGRVNFRTTTPIPRDKILPIMEIILRLNGIAVIEESGLYRIIPIGNISKEPAPIRFGKDPESVELKGTALLQLVPLTYINSSEMASILTPLLTQGGAIYDIQKKNVLLVADTDTNVRRMLQVVAMFDVDTYKDASQPKVYVYPLQNSKAEHVAKIIQQVILGAAPSSGGAGVKTITGGPSSITPSGPNVPKAGPTASQAPFSGGSSGEPLVAASTKVVADEVANSLVIYASPADYAVILGAIKQIDTMPRQVMIEAVVADLDLTDGITLGMRWNLNINNTYKPFAKTVSLGGPLGFQQLGALGTGTFGYTAMDRTGNVRLAIEADATTKKAKILSAPHILVADNREARIQVGKQVPLATSTTTTPLTATSTTTAITTTNTTTSTIQYKDVGTILKVKPQVNDSGLIALEISQEVSDAVPVNILGTDQFEITKNEVTTNLVAQDGETIIIGGLINESDSDSNSGIPFLNKIPVLRYLFGTTTISKDRHEVVILLTPHVVRNQEEARKVTSDYYELFKNIGKEINLEKYKKTAPVKPTSTQTSPEGKNTSPEMGKSAGQNKP